MRQSAGFEITLIVWIRYFNNGMVNIILFVGIHRNISIVKFDILGGIPFHQEDSTQGSGSLPHTCVQPTFGSVRLHSFVGGSVFQS
jgi:hypothetical protein